MFVITKQKIMFQSGSELYNLGLKSVGSGGGLVDMMSHVAIVVKL